MTQNLLLIIDIECRLAQELLNANQSAAPSILERNATVGRPLLAVFYLPTQNRTQEWRYLHTCRFRDIDYRMIRLFATLADATEFNVIRS